jgi:DnaJ-class molecular chaperone
MSERCKDCGGKGWAWQLPSGMNAFAMKMEAITMHSRRVDCYSCHGEGTLSTPPVNAMGNKTGGEL